MVEDNDGNLGIGTQWDGIVRLNAQAGKFHARTRDNNKQDVAAFSHIGATEVGSPFETVVDLAVATNHGIWAHLGMRQNFVPFSRILDPCSPRLPLIDPGKVIRIISPEGRLQWVSCFTSTTSAMRNASPMGDGTGNSNQMKNLLDLAAHGEQAAYDEVINLAADRLQRLTATMLRNYPHLRRWEDTSDVFQTAAIRLHQSLSEVRPDSVRSFFGLAGTQIRRALIDLARHHFGPQGQAVRHHTDVGASHGGGIVKNEPTKTERPETLASWTEFHQAVERLADPEREVFQLVWYGGMYQQDIASLLGISVPTVKRRLRAARRHLYQSLQGECPLDTQGSQHD